MHQAPSLSLSLSLLLACARTTSKPGDEDDIGTPSDGGSPTDGGTELPVLVDPYPPCQASFKLSPIRSHHGDHCS